ncbi:hypothetical protein OS175_10240 [Marinicella sp. S1101]|uniref:hypothetical protein n=1 Tax=Marinicella marina TaxID=2996016 RepID=UPI0022609BDC|nr:hypothetical protein [Marinicella marina]MCX7554259.1 hypothetical protein [Marinicella marina]
MCNNELKLRELKGRFLKEHKYLEESDSCAYFGEYTVNQEKTWGYSKTNQLIVNIKKNPVTSSQAELYYKQQAIKETGELFGHKLTSKSKLLLVPIPSSKTKDHPEYDDKIFQLCLAAKVANPEIDVCELILPAKHVKPFHESPNNRMPPNELANCYRFNAGEDFDETKYSHIVLVDDVITSGSHFKACKSILERNIESSSIYGLFVARAIEKEIDPSDYFD